MKTVVCCMLAMCFFSYESLAQSITLSTSLYNKNGNPLQGYHIIDLRLINNYSNKVESWKQSKKVILKDGIVFVELGDVNQGASGPFPEELINTHKLEISENGVVLQSVSLSPQQDNTLTIKTPPSLQGSKVLLSEIDQGNANDGQLLTWDNSAKSWRPKLPQGGTTTQTGVNTLNSQKGDIEATSPLTLSSVSNKITFGLASNAIPQNTGVPVGTVVAFFGNETRIPEGWLLCDGRTFVKTDYPQLSDLLDNSGLSPTNTPDLRGQFLRGGNLTSKGNRDSVSGDANFANRTGTGQKIGSFQSDAIQQHSHNLRNTNQNQEQISLCYVGANGYGNAWYLIDPTCSSNSSYKNNHDAGLAVGKVRSDIDANGSPARTAYETRPKNVAVNWIIKAKP